MRREPETAAQAAKAARPPRRRGRRSTCRRRPLPVFERLARLARPPRPRSRACRAYVVFHDATLREIATAAPTSLAELGTVNGVGENKLAKYGQQILDVLAGRETQPAAGAGDAPAPARTPSTGAGSRTTGGRPARGGAADAPILEEPPEDDQYEPGPEDEAIDW